ncbi:hypothetical protein BTS2_0882 [Bacillus sp. TS-2]|nr:hypothetical protein BTS2_0882 [Bacillus sp. TS-2]
MINMKQLPLQNFANQIKEGIVLVKSEKYEAGMQQLAPFVEIMKESNKSHIRLFFYYSIAQLRLGEIDGFLESYRLIQLMEATTREEELMKQELNPLFKQLLEELGSE